MYSLSFFTPEMAAEFFTSLCSLLPPPSSNTPEARQARDQIAIETVLALHPADAFEAELAAGVVATSAQAKHCLRLAAQPDRDPDQSHRDRDKAGAMLRHVQSLTRLLQTRQVKREKQEAEMHPSAMTRAGYWYRDVETPEQAQQPANPAYETMTEAEQYAIIHPRRAAAIRAHGGLPPNCTFGAPDPAIVKAIVSGTSPIFRELDRAVAAVT
jgi:hypothetical protein